MISFIVPTLNEEAAIQKTLESVSNYSGAKEIIVSDGGSRDKTAEIAKSFTDKVLVYSGTTRQNIPAGRNAGAKVAIGDYILFLDADVTIVDPDIFFKKALSNFENDSSLVALTVAVRVLKDMETSADKYIFSTMNFLHFFVNNILGKGVAPGEFQMVRADAFRKIGGYNEALHANEDYDLFRRLREVGKTHFDKSLTVYHTGRRAHKIGWPKLLSLWFKNFISVLFLKKSASTEWVEIR